MKRSIIFLLTPLLLAFQCEEEIDLTEDQLFDTGIYGGWKFSDETINGATTMTPPAEIYLDFFADQNLKDSQGDYTLAEVSKHTDGKFILDEVNQQITFQRNDRRDDIVYGYVMNADKDYLIFNYTEGKAQIELGWTRLY